MAIGTRAFEKSFGFEVKVLSDAPGPHRMKACRPGEGSVACGIVGVEDVFGYRLSLAMKFHARKEVGDGLVCTTQPVDAFPGWFCLVE